MRRILMLFAFFAFGACATTSAAGGRDPDRIDLEEIMATDVSTAYELVEQLRPRWFISRGDRSQRLETVIAVYLDNALLGGIETLRSIPRHTIESLRALGAAEAGQLPGAGSRHVERAIVVRTRTSVR